MRAAIVLVLLASAVVESSSARAGTDFVASVEIKSGKPSKCTLNATTNGGADDSLKVSLATNGVAQSASEALTIKVDSDPAVSETVAKGKLGATFAKGAYANRKLTLEDPSGPLTADGCKPRLLVSDSAAADPSPTPSAVDLQASTLNQSALAYMAGQNISGHRMEGGVLGKHYRLYHLPDGTPAFPLPAHISEKDHVEIWTALLIGTKATVTVVACDKVPGYRVKGSYKDAAAAAGGLQSLRGPSGALPQFALQAYPQQLQCAGTLTYKIEASGQSTTTSITIDPVYRFEWGVGYGFGFGKPQHLSLGDRPAASGMGTEKFVVASNDFTGAEPIITLGVDVCGTDPADLNWCDRLLMPSIWIDPTRLTQGFGVGLVFRPIFGVGLLAGMSVFQSTELADGLTVKAGDTWTASGDLPTKKVFNKNSLGLMLAVTLDTGIFAALVP
jgi:hypothetical protein